MFVSQQRDPVTEAWFRPPSRKMMVFADGENLVCRYQAMLGKGFIPRDDMAHVKDAYVWCHAYPHEAQQHEVLRATYYTSATGDDARLNQIRDELKELKVGRHRASFTPNTLSPCVFKKHNKSRSSKGVDIQMCVDILGNVYRGNTDSILIMSGDGDFVPLIEEVKRAGVLVYVTAFSDGVNPELARSSDSFRTLDDSTWKQTPESQ